MNNTKTTNPNKTASLAEDFAPKQNPRNRFAPNPGENLLDDLQQFEPNAKKIDLDFLHQAPEKAKPREHDSSTNLFESFISKQLVKFTTASSIIVNLISAPVRLFDNNNPLKQIINHISMFFTKFHLATYSISGLFTAIKKKNPFLIFSYLTEGLAAMPFLGLRNIYLFRGIATGIDGAAAGVIGKYKKSEFTSYKQAWNEVIEAVKDTTLEFLKKFSADWTHIFRLEGPDIAIFASLIAACGGVIGMTINEKIGGIIRDVFGAGGDVGIVSIDNEVAKKSGMFYLAGSILDLAARVFNKIVPGIIGVKDTSAFEKIRDAFHEVSIASDRLGQYHFLRFTEQSNKALATAAI